MNRRRDGSCGTKFEQVCMMEVMELERVERLIGDGPGRYRPGMSIGCISTK